MRIEDLGECELIWESFEKWRKKNHASKNYSTFCKWLDLKWDILSVADVLYRTLYNIMQLQVCMEGVIEDMELVQISNNKKKNAERK